MKFMTFGGDLAQKLNFSLFFRQKTRIKSSFCGNPVFDFTHYSRIWGFFTQNRQNLQVA